MRANCCALLPNTKASKPPPVPTVEELPILTATVAASPSGSRADPGGRASAHCAAGASAANGAGRRTRRPGGRRISPPGAARPRQATAGVPSPRGELPEGCRAALQAVGLGLAGGILGGLLLGALASDMRREAPPLFGIFGGLSLWCLVFFWVRDWQLRSPESRRTSGGCRRRQPETDDPHGSPAGAASRHRGGGAVRRLACEPDLLLPWL